MWKIAIRSGARDDFKKKGKTRGRSSKRMRGSGWEGPNEEIRYHPVGGLSAGARTFGRVGGKAKRPSGPPRVPEK